MKPLLACIFLTCQSIGVYGQHTLGIGEFVYVISDSGLNLRAENSTISKVLKILVPGKKVKVNDIDNINDTTNVNGIKGRWLQVIDPTDSIEGFVFDYYLSQYPPFQFIKNNSNGCWQNDLLYDMANAIGKKDSFEYSNYKNGEGAYVIKYYKLNKNASYIEHGYWEHWENEIQFNNLNTYQIKQYVNSILSQCKLNKTTIEENYFESNKILSINYQENCCVHNINIYSEGNNLIVRIQSEPGS
ncbi:MAG TPA: SH3 domain-containing protein [Saprospiraceae bacterium]|nr:SH3 domain-containing protein [Saprospiraceae bacterium]